MGCLETTLPKKMKSELKPLPNSNKEVSFKEAVTKVFLKSVFGTYLRFFNSQQIQDKFLNENKYGITIWDVTKLSDRDKKKYKMLNEFVNDDMDGLLREAVRKENCIDWDYLYEKLLILRISDNASILKKYFVLARKPIIFVYPLLSRFRSIIDDSDLLLNAPRNFERLASPP